MGGSDDVGSAGGDPISSSIRSGRVPGLGAGGGQASAGRQSRLTREAVEKATCDVQLAEGLKAAEQDLKESSRGSSAGEETEKRENLKEAEVDVCAAEHRVERLLSPLAIRPSGAIVGSGLCKEDPDKHPKDPKRSTPTSSSTGENELRLAARRSSRSSPCSSSVGKESTSSSSQVTSQPALGPTTAASSSAGTGSCTSSHLTDLLERLAFAQDARIRAEDDLASMKKALAMNSEECCAQVADLQRKLRKAVAKEMERGRDNSALLQKIAGMEAVGATQVADLLQQLQAARTANAELKDERDSEADRLCGVEARSAARVEQLTGELQEAREQTDMLKVQDEATRAARSAQVELTRCEMLELQQELAEERTKGKSLADQKDILKRADLEQKEAHVAETSRLKVMLDAATHELRILSQGSADDDDDCSDLGAAPADVKPQPRRRHLRLLEAQLVSQRESQREMSDELSELRLQMCGMMQGHQAQIGDLQSLLEEANQKLQDGSGGRTSGSGSPSSAGGGARTLQTKKRGPSWARRAAKKNELASIDEEEDDDLVSNDGSVAASGCVSSPGDDGVGDLGDFDDDGLGDASGAEARPEDVARIALLEAELAQSRQENWRLKEELAGSKAEWASKHRRLTESMKNMQQGDEIAKQELASLKHAMAGQSAHHNAQLDVLKDRLAASESDVADKDELYQALLEDVRRKEESQEASTDETKQELFRAIEAKRIASNRLEDMKRELESTHRRYESVVADLQAQLARQGAPVERVEEPGELVDTFELQALKERLQGAVEDRNLLAHTLEWKEVQWKSKLEHLELESKQLLTDIKQHHSLEVEKLQRKINEMKADFKQRLERAEELVREAESKVPQVSTNPAPKTPGVAGAWLSILRCPARLADAVPVPKPSASGGPEAAFCRDVCWQVLNSVTGVIAFMCDSPSLKIIQVTEGASSIWGPQTLVGSLVVSLLAAPASAAWLRRAILTHQALVKMEGGPGDVPGFAVHPLGRLEFQQGHGSFESSVTVAHLPAEPRLNREVAVIVLIEPQLSARPPPRHSSSSAETRSEVRGYSPSSVVDDVQPSDSASNIGARYF